VNPHASLRMTKCMQTRFTSSWFFFGPRRQVWTARLEVVPFAIRRFHDRQD
jgi:hypothetical protein